VTLTFISYEILATVIRHHTAHSQKPFVAVLIAVTMRSSFFRNVTPCSLVEAGRRFWGTYSYFLHLQGRRVSQASSKLAWLTQQDESSAFLKDSGALLQDYTVSQKIVIIFYILSMYFFKYSLHQKLHKIKAAYLSEI
jgi:hypothetical protein